MSEIKTNKISSLDSSNSDITIDPDGTGDTIIASGNLGIGTTSPDTALTVKSSGTTTTFASFVNSSGNGKFEFREGGSNTQIFQGFDASNNEQIRLNPTSDSFINGGNVGIGISSPSFTSGNGLHLADNFFAGFGTGENGRPDFQIGTVGGSTLDFRCGTGADTVDLSISTGGVFTGDFNDTSDERLKENIQDIAANQIDIVKQLRPVTFDWKATEKTSNTGFIAQEVALLLPNDVQRSDPDDSDSTLGINSMALVATLTAALKESISKIEALETENSTQATQIADLITRVTALENA